MNFYVLDACALVALLHDRRLWRIVLLESSFAPLSALFLVGKINAESADGYHKGKNKNNHRGIHFTPRFAKYIATLKVSTPSIAARKPFPVVVLWYTATRKLPTLNFSIQSRTSAGILASIQ
jgi:hypothetical protein